MPTIICNLVRCSRIGLWCSTDIGTQKLWLWRNITRRMSRKQVLLG